MTCSQIWLIPLVDDLPASVFFTDKILPEREIKY
jgi:hypothetical protein